MDPDFPPDHTSIGCAENSTLRTIPSWAPIQELFPERPLLGKIDPNDLRQGDVGDCWLLAAIQTLAEYPDSIKNVFKTQEHPADGKYVLCLYDIKEETWKDVEVDCRIPCLNGKPVYVKPGRRGVWLCLLEKACAKLFGSYLKLNGGEVSIGWKMICGPGDLSEIHKHNPEKEWKETTIDPKQVLEDGLVMKDQMQILMSQFTRTGRHSDIKVGEKVEKDQLFSKILAWDRSQFLMSCDRCPDELDPEAPAAIPENGTSLFEKRMHLRLTTFF